MKSAGADARRASALFSGPGLWSAWPAAEFISFIITAVFLWKYREKYKYA